MIVLTLYQRFSTSLSHSSLVIFASFIIFRIMPFPMSSPGCIVIIVVLPSGCRMNKWLPFCLRAYPKNQSIIYFRMSHRDVDKYIEKSSLCLCVSVAFDNICHGGTENTEMCLKISVPLCGFNFSDGRGSYLLKTYLFKCLYNFLTGRGFILSIRLVAK